MATSKMLKFGPPLRELRIHLCQKSDASKGVRDFVEKHYVPLKQNNPVFPILVRECSGIHPKVYARYEFGEEKSVALAGMNDSQVLQTIESLAQKK